MRKCSGSRRSSSRAVAVEDSFDRTDTGADSCRESVLAGSFQSLATGNTALQHLRINQGLIDAFSRRLEFVCAFQFHWTLAFAALNCSARVHLREVTPVVTRSVKIGIRIDTVADMRDCRCDCVVVEVRSCKRSFDSLRAIGFGADTSDSDRR